MPQNADIVDVSGISNLAGLLQARLARSPDAVAYRQYDANGAAWTTTTWTEFSAEVCCWQAALRAEKLEAGDRVAIMLNNRREWAAFDMAALGLGLVTVPLYNNDRPENMGLVLEDCGAKLLLIGNQKSWGALVAVESTLAALTKIVSLEPVSASPSGLQPVPVSEWLPASGDALQVEPVDADALATICYTSGTTGRPKGVMLSHRNILFNVGAVLEQVPALRDDLFLSLLPLSHMLERTIGYYVPMAAGSTVAYARTSQSFAADFATLKPTIVVAVPRVFERIYAAIQAELDKHPAAMKRFVNAHAANGWKHFLRVQGRGRRSPLNALWSAIDAVVGDKLRYKFGGRLRIAVGGGAALAPEIAHFFLGLGIPIVQGYGLTETSPVVCSNALEDNVPESVGKALRGIEVRLGERDELLTRSPSVMRGYWNNPDATSKAIDADGWFHTGDIARIDDAGHVFITGRLKEIIVLANGEKVPPGDMENAITIDSLFLQVMVLGEAKPYLSALVLLDMHQYATLAQQEGFSVDLAEECHGTRLEKVLTRRIAARLKDFPGYAKIRRVGVCETPWTVESGLMTPTLKVRREKVLAVFESDVARLYEGH
jgi:long-chain acyl-CoA synthetase